MLRFPPSWLRLRRQTGPEGKEIGRVLVQVVDLAVELTAETVDNSDGVQAVTAEFKEMILAGDKVFFELFSRT